MGEDLQGMFLGSAKVFVVKQREVAELKQFRQTRNGLYAFLRKGKQCHFFEPGAALNLIHITGEFRKQWTYIYI